MAGYPLYKHIQDIIVNQIRVALISLADQGIVVRVQGKGTFVLDNDITNQILDKNNKCAISNENNTFFGIIMPTMKTKVEQRLLYYVEKYLYEFGHHLILRITDESLAFESTDN